MVVEYLDVGQARPHVRGAFVADDEVDDLLRQTEPKAHDSWQTRSKEGGLEPDAPLVADAVTRRVREHVRKFRDQLRPASRPAEDVRLPELERLFGRIFSSSSSNSSGPPSSERPFSILVEERLQHAGDGLIRLKGQVGFALAAHHPASDAVVDVAVSFRFVEEGGNGEEAVLVVASPQTFGVIGEKPYVYRGTLTHDRVTFEFESAPYPADWSGRLKGDVSFVNQQEMAG